MAVLHSVEQAVLIVHETVKHIAGAMSRGELESLFELGGIWLMAYSANAVMVKLGLMPGLAGMIDPSTTYSPG